MEESSARRPTEATPPLASMRAVEHAPGLEHPASGPARARERAAVVGLEDQACLIGGEGREHNV
eukprot:2256449-Alexandrium_andersonii.AAC.1